MRRLAILLVMLLASSACTRSKSQQPQEAAAKRTVVFVSFQPLTDWALRIGGPSTDVRLVCAPTEDPAECQPNSEALVAAQNAAFVLLNGARFERWPESASLSPSRLVDTSASFADELINYEQTIEHRHGPLGETHQHAGLDGHTWLDPQLAKRQADAVLERFETTWPEQAPEFRKRAEALALDFEKLDSRHVELGPRLAERSVLASHPAYNYVARRYGWKLTNLEIDPGSPLDPRTRTLLQAHRNANPETVVLFESAPLPALQEELQRDLGLALVVFSPAERRSDEGDYFAVMNANLDRLKAALGGGVVQE